MLTSSTSNNSSAPSKVMGITVFAGNDAVICQSATLLLSDLNATITGDVTDGYWFTKGDGFFDPGGMNNVLFSIGNIYIPGPNDIVIGHFDLILVSFDPDGNGPESQVKDTVKITLQNSPVLVCHGNLNISLGNNCTETVTPQMLLTNPVQPFSQYTVLLTDPDGNVLPNDILTVNEIEKSIIFTVGHLCGTTTCWGTLRPQDKTPPVLQCANFTILCDQNSSADSIGYPVTNNATVIKTGPNTYSVSNLDACSFVNMSYSDEVQDMNCLGGLQGRIIRRWTAADASNNTNTCTQVISIKTKGIKDVSLPPHYNDTAKPSLECNGNWPQLSNGHPSPSYTGSPNTAGCKYLESTYSDITFDFCGSTYKILRKWLMVDWCTNETKEYNQIIKIIDTRAPSFKVADSLYLYTTTYDCFTAKTKVPRVTNVIDCSGVDTSFIIKDTFNNNFSHLVTTKKDTFYLDSLPVGYYLGSYILVDECGNRDTASFPIKVMDNKAPFAICGNFIKISIINNGTARMFPNSINDGSVDNCMIDSFAVAKMIDLCSNNAGKFGRYVDFCCAETANPVMVALRVTDIYGNNNTCMVEVTVEDKEKPVISCPSNITIDCDYPIDESNLSEFGTIVPTSNLIKPFYIYDNHNNGFAGTDGLATDNCMVSYDSTHILDITCFEGSLYRDFIATDLYGNKASCRQTIRIKNHNPFMSSNIVWPANIDIDGCDTLNIDLDITKKPTYNNTNCANVESTYSDQYFYNTAEACIKVLRTWTVIDWCTYDQSNGKGLYTYAQFIKLNNSIAPSIATTCKDTVVCHYAIDCVKEKYIKNLSASDDCTTTNKLSWSWEIDADNDGTIEFSGKSNIIDVLLDKGSYKVYVEVMDQCGNLSTCDYNIITKDCKKPTPYCVSNLSTVIMPSTKQLEIVAKQFDYNSYDNCTKMENLLFSFSTNKYDSTKIITCNDISNGVADIISISLYVTDESGNQDFCMVELAIQDNDDVCQDVGSLSAVSGSFKTFNNKKVANAIVAINSDVDIYNQSKFTDANGQYAFSALPSPLKYNLSATHNGPANEQLSTFDLILLQRHILGIAPLISPYQIIAGDANGSNKINVSDLVAIRKVLLGVTNEFAPGVPSWIFIDGKQEFQDPKSPWSYNEFITLETLQNGDNKADFIAVKVGDINGSIGNVRSNDPVENRNQKVKNLTKSTVGNTNTFLTSEFMNLDGFQLKLNVESFESITFNTNIEEYSNYYVSEDNMITIICYLPQPISFDAGEMLFIINSNKTTLDERTNIAPEIYIDNEEYGLEVTKVNNGVINNKATNCTIKYQSGQLILSSNIEDIDNLYIYNIEGKLIQNISIVNNSDLMFTAPSGIYIVSFYSKNIKYNKKVFIP